jgi:hypothetical protein
LLGINLPLPGNSVARGNLIGRIGFTFIAIAALFCGWIVSTSRAADPPTTAPALLGNLPHIRIDAHNHRVEVDCEALAVEQPLEFFCVMSGGNEYESVLRSPAKPSDIHLALLMIGLTPGGNVHPDPQTQKWMPPFGPALNISCQYTLNGKAVDVPAWKMMRSVKDKTTMPPMTWVFCGSKVMDSGVYAADQTSYTVSVVNFDYTLIDIPTLASNANETLEWERDPAMAPPKGTPVVMTIEPAEHATTLPAEKSEKPNEPIAMALVSIDADGKIELEHAPVKASELAGRLQDMKKRGATKVGLSADPAGPATALASVIDAVTAAGMDMEIRKPSTRPATQP